MHVYNVSVCGVTVMVVRATGKHADLESMQKHFLMFILLGKQTNTPIISPISKDKETDPTQNFRITGLISNLHICLQMPTYHKPGTVLGTKHREMNQTGRLSLAPALKKLSFVGQTDKQPVNHNPVC